MTEEQKKIVGNIKLQWPEWYKNEHPKARELVEMIGDIDFYNGDTMCIKTGGDGDNGETLIAIISEILNKGLWTL